MSKKKDTKREEKSTSPEASLPEDKPDKVEMAPPTKDVDAQASVLKRGIAMEKVDSPRFGVPGQAIATRGAAGGGAYNPSGQVGRSPTNPEVRGPGSDPLNKMDIRDELAWNEMGAEQYRTLIDGSAAGFAPDSILGNYTYEDNLVFQFDNAGLRPGVKNAPYRRRIESVEKDQCIFIAGQHDAAAKTPMVFYPTQTYSRTAARAVVDVADPAHRSNYLMRGMTVRIGYHGSVYSIDSINFDTEELPCTSTPEDLDVRYDNARVFWDIADKDITETYFDMVNQPSNLQANKFSPLPDGQPAAMQHLMLSRDIANTDGCIAFLALRSAMETYAYHRLLRKQYGAGEGARAQARYMLEERVAPNTECNSFLWADSADMSGAGGVSEAVGAHNSDYIRLSMPEYITTFLDSPTKYNSGFGVWLVQPRGLKLLFEEAQKSFDDCEFMIDKDTLTIMNKIFGWKDVDGRLAGVTRLGLIVPVDYNQVYEVNDNGEVVCDERGQVHSRYTYVDYVLNGSFYNKTEVRSPLVDAILQVFRYRIIPKLTRDGPYEFYIPFDFACDHYSFGHAILMEAVAYMHQFIQPARAVFKRFEMQYGVNPLLSSQMQELKLADVLAESCYKGIGADPVMPSGSEALRLLLTVPEVYQMGVRTWDNGLLDAPNVLVALKFTDLAPLSDSIAEPQRLLFPMLYQTETLGQWRHIKDMGPEKLLCSRDFPIHRYALDLDGAYQRRDDMASTPASNLMPFFARQAPQVYYCENSNDSELTLTVGNVLSCPRYSGRIAPAPIGLLDFVRSGVSMDCGSFDDYHLGQRGHSGTTQYGWMANIDDNIISVSEDSGKVAVRGYDIDNYRVSFVYMPPYEQSQLGSLLMRYFVHFASGCLAQGTLDDLQEIYGIWIATEQQSVTLDDCGAFAAAKSLDHTINAGDSFTVSKQYNRLTVEGDTTIYDIAPGAIGATGLNVTETGIIIKRWEVTNRGGQPIAVSFLGTSRGVALGYVDDAMKMWTNDNIMEFIFSPFTGNIDEELNNNDDQFVEVDRDITLPLMFGFAGYQELFYDRKNVDNYSKKQAVGGRIYDDEMLRQANVFFE